MAWALPDTVTPSLPPSVSHSALLCCHSIPWHLSGVTNPRGDEDRGGHTPPCHPDITCVSPRPPSSCAQL